MPSYSRCCRPSVTTRWTKQSDRYISHFCFARSHRHYSTPNTFRRLFSGPIDRKFNENDDDDETDFFVVVVSTSTNPLGRRHPLQELHREGLGVPRRPPRVTERHEGTITFLCRSSFCLVLLLFQHRNTLSFISVSQLCSLSLLSHCHH